MILKNICSGFMYVDIYEFCEEYYYMTEGIKFNITKIDKDKSDAKSRWAIEATETNLKKHSFFLNNLTSEEVFNNFEKKFEEAKV